MNRSIKLNTSREDPLVTPDQYLQGTLHREAVDTGPHSPVRGVQATLLPIIREWAGGMLLSVNPSGSFAKGTANASGTDIDLFISLSESTTLTLKEIYESLFWRMQERSLSPKRQNVSVNVRANGYDVDLVPGKRQSSSGDDHSLYRRKADTWTKTNVVRHINHVVNAKCAAEIRIIKLWRSQKALDFPSFYLELTVINALTYASGSDLESRVFSILRYLRDSFPSARVVDPANTNNVVSDDLTLTERAKVKAAAERALAAKDWGEIVV